jgi:hypothetical protein
MIPTSNAGWRAAWPLNMTRGNDPAIATPDEMRERGIALPRDVEQRVTNNSST